MPDAPGLELLLAEINRHHPGAVIDTSFDREQPALLVDPAFVTEVLGWLRDTPGQEYTFLASVHGVDYFPNAPRFAVHYELINRERYERLRVKAIVSEPEQVEGAASVGDSPGRPRSARPGVPGNATPTNVVSDEGAPTTPEQEEPSSATDTESQKTDDSSGADASSSAAGSDAGTTVAASVGGGPDELPEEGTPPAIAQTKPSEQVPPAFESGTASDMPDASGRPDAGSGIATFEYEGQTLPSLKSCVELFPTAEFQEREVFDFFGIHFEGHPDLRRILMPEDYVGWPQRRDFPVGGEPVLFTKDEVDNPGWWK